MIPLAKLLVFTTDDLSIRVGQTLAGLLNATLGNVNSPDAVRDVDYAPRRPTTQRTAKILPQSSSSKLGRTKNIMDSPTRLRTTGDTEAGSVQAATEGEGEGEGEVTPKMNVFMTCGLLIAVTVLVVFTVMQLIRAIDGLTANKYITQEFICVILLPLIVGRAMEQAMSIMAHQDKDISKPG
ncbi:hypothetical protein DXG01_006353, partial [Tephrocybe rancida]